MPDILAIRCLSEGDALTDLRFRATLPGLHGVSAVRSVERALERFRIVEIASQNFGSVIFQFACFLLLGIADQCANRKPTLLQMTDRGATLFAGGSGDEDRAILLYCHSWCLHPIGSGSPALCPVTLSPRAGCNRSSPALSRAAPNSRRIHRIRHLACRRRAARK